jgi:hypothetical protein
MEEEMKTKLLLIIFLMVQVSLAQTTLEYRQSEDQTAERTYQDSTGFYIIHFEYNTASCSIPLTNPPGQPHYFATITVYKIVEGKKTQIGEPFSGQYTENGCFEDEPSYLINSAKQQSKKVDITDKDLNPIKFYSGVNATRILSSPKFTGSYYFQKKDSLVIIVGEDTVYGKDKSNQTQLMLKASYTIPNQKTVLFLEDFISLWKDYQTIVLARYDSMQTWKDTVVKRWDDFGQIYTQYKSGGLYVTSREGWNFYKPNTYEIDKDGYVVTDLYTVIYSYDFLKPTFEGFMDFIKSRGEK